ncbi:related to 4-coumarate-CoA ligase [Sporisorium scitamineum]|uniref:Related to 4-coumarate-CoA ligase n=2 Tax=Sporisorium scitamineum TaxID=49012 RepID=A0A127Z9Y8_9BASI|nr:related to 4-coumarate-CoA ligase [Sporisorium scitamineum]
MAPQILTSIYPPLPKASYTNIFDYVSSGLESSLADKVQFVRQDGKEFTHGQVVREARRLAWTLRHKLGLQPRQRVGIISPNHTMYPIFVFAAEVAGLVTAPVNPTLTVGELAKSLQQASVDIVLAHPSCQDNARAAWEQAKAAMGRASSSTSSSGGASEGLFMFDHVDEPVVGKQGEPDLRAQLTENELESYRVEDPATETAFIMFSSGTSGSAKGVEITHSNVIHSVMALVATHDDYFGQKDVQVGFLPFYHIFGLIKLMHHPFYLGMKIVILPKFSLDLFCEKIQEHRATASLVVPPVLLQLAKSPVPEKYNMSSLKCVQCGAAPLSAELFELLEKRYPGMAVLNGYGLTESLPSVICSGPKELPNSKGAAGRIAPGVEVRLVSEEGHDVGQEQGREGVPGEVWLRGPTIMKGYLDNEEATRDAFTADGWFKTGDVAVMRNTEIFIVDRIKDLIKFKGFQVSPAELEAVITSHPEVADVAVFGVWCPAQMTEVPRACIVPRDLELLNRPEECMELEKRVREHMEKLVAAHKKIRGGIEWVATIPKSPSGKILRRLLRDEAARAAAKADERSQLRSTLVTTLQPVNAGAGTEDDEARDSSIFSPISPVAAA